MPTDGTMQKLLAAFNDPGHARRYGDGPQRFMPGYEDLHRMTAVLLAERAPPALTMSCGPSPVTVKLGASAASDRRCSPFGEAWKLVCMRSHLPRTVTVVSPPDRITQGFATGSPCAAA